MYKETCLRHSISLFPSRHNISLFLFTCAGGGVTQIVMPYMTEGIAKHVPEFEAWRWAFFLPGGLYICITFLIFMFGQVKIQPCPFGWPCGCSTCCLRPSVQKQTRNHTGSPPCITRWLTAQFVTVGEGPKHAAHRVVF
jgi:hypothetical protein